MTKHISTTDLTLFLDFDGVLHPGCEYNQESGMTVWFDSDFRHAKLLVALLETALPKIDIVISSSWGRSRNLTTLKSLLPPALTDRVVDAVHQKMSLDVRWPHSRFYEIRWHLEHVRPDIGDRWLAVDDDDMGWLDDMRHHLAWCENDLGDPASQVALIHGLARFGLMVEPTS